MKKKNKDSRTPETKGIWRTPIDELFTKLGLPLTTGNKTGSVVIIPKRAEDESK